MSERASERAKECATHHGREVLVAEVAVPELPLVAGAEGVHLAVLGQRHAVLPAARDLPHALPLEVFDGHEDGLVRVVSLVAREIARVPQPELPLVVAPADEHLFVWFVPSDAIQEGERVDWVVGRMERYNSNLYRRRRISDTRVAPITVRSRIE